MNIKQLLGLKIKNLRKKKRISQEHFSELLNMNPRQIVRIENGESFPTAENLEKIASTLGITVQELFYNECFMPDDILKAKIADQIEDMDSERLRMLYLMVSNL